MIASGPIICYQYMLVRLNLLSRTINLDEER